MPVFDIPAAITAVANLVNKLLDKTAPDSPEAKARLVLKAKARASSVSKKVKKSQLERKD